MLRLRRLLVSRKIFFVTCNLLRTRLKFTENDFECLAEALRQVRARREFRLAGYIFMPNHWHALVVPRPGDTLASLMEAAKISGTRRINNGRKARGPLWQARYFDSIIWNVKGFNDTLAYMHLNPVRKGLVRRPEEWAWSSIHSFGGPGPVRLEIDQLNLPTAQDAPL
jgi:REP-associated tyrosine transposase